MADKRTTVAKFFYKGLRLRMLCHFKYWAFIAAIAILFPFGVNAQDITEKWRTQLALNMFTEICLFDLPDLQNTVLRAKEKYSLKVNFEENGAIYLDAGRFMPGVVAQPGKSCSVNSRFTPIDQSTVNAFLQLLEDHNITTDKQTPLTGEPGEKVYIMLIDAAHSSQQPIRLLLKSSSLGHSLKLEVARVED